MAETLFFQDVLETPQALQDTLLRAADPASALANQLLARGARRFAVLGGGTSYYAGAASLYLHNALVAPEGTITTMMMTGEYHLYPLPLAPHDVLVGVSASGEITDLLDVCEQARGHLQRVAVTNAADSSLTRVVDHLLLMHAGLSRVPTSTRTFVTSVATLHLLWLGLLERQGIGKAATLRHELSSLPRAVAHSLDQARDQVTTVARAMERCLRFFVVGAGPAYALAGEVALVLKEVANLPAEAMQTREMVQGPTSVVDAATGVIVINPPGRGQEAGRQVLAQCADLGAATLEVGPSPSGFQIDAACHELFVPLIYSSPLFLLANALGMQRGVDIDHPQWEAEYLRATRRQATHVPS